MTTSMLIKLAVIFGILSLLLFVFWLSGTMRAQKTTPPPSGEAKVALRTQTGEEVFVPVEIAATSADKFQGLSNRSSLEANRGMLFVWDQNIQTTFVMRQMEFPLDVIFIRGEEDGSGVIVDIAENLPACPGKTSGCATASAPESFRWVLEVNAGFSTQNGIAVGDSVQIAYTDQ